MLTEEITIAEHLIKRLSELGINHLYGVPGDYQLDFLDYVENSKLIEWRGNCNELNAAYAADGYARIKGMGAFLTTNGPGELSAVNGLAGSYAENVAVVHIVGMPPTAAQNKRLPVHHTYGNGKFTLFADLQNNVTCAREIIEPTTAVTQIDSILHECWLHQKPVLISIAYDVFLAKVLSPKVPIALMLAKSTEEELNPIMDKILVTLNQAKFPVIIVDAKVKTHGLITRITEFIERSNLPFVTTSAAMGIISQDHPNFCGMYDGVLSHESVLTLVKNSDLLIFAGRFDTDTNSWGFTTERDLTKMIILQYNKVQILGKERQKINTLQLLELLLPKLEASELNKPIISKPIPQHTEESLTQQKFWQKMESVIEENSNVIVEQGTSYFGIQDCNLAKNVSVISQPLWGSIGFSVGATLGVLGASNKPHTYLFVGDGSFQLSGQEVSQMARHGYTPIIFLINNTGYTVERAIHGAMRKYNDIATWDYTHFVEAFTGNIKTWKIHTLAELEALPAELNSHKDKLRFIEVFFNQTDMPDVMAKLFNGSSWVV